MTENWFVNNFSWLFNKYNATLLGLWIGIETIPWWCKQYANIKKRNEINEVIFTQHKKCPDCTPKSGNNYCSNKYCYNYTLRQMKSFIDGAQHSLYITMNVFTNSDLGEMVLRAHERGISVKIVANESTAYASGSQIEKLHRSGGFPLSFNDLMIDMTVKSKFSFCVIRHSSSTIKVT